MACIRKRRDRWVIDFYDNRGKRRWKTMPKGSTKAKARSAMRKIEDQIARGIYFPDKRIPLFSEVASQWIEFKKPNLRASTWSVYKGHTRNHFHDLDNILINRINAIKVEKYIADRQEQGMNVSTIRKILVTLGQIFKYAVRHGYLEQNPLLNAERPRGTGHTEKKKVRILNISEINSLLDATKKPKYKTLFRLAIMSGARQGELLGLKWSDIDWENSQIHIQRTFNNQEWYKPKTATSHRKIDLGPSMMAELKEWCLACPPNDLDLVFPNKAGHPINNTNMRHRHFNSALKTAGIEKIRFHDLRHTYASLLIEQGENIKYIQKQLGHSSPTVTWNVYAHLMKPVNQEAACKLENMVFENNGSRMVAEKNKGLQEIL